VSPCPKAAIPVVGGRRWLPASRRSSTTFAMIYVRHGSSNHISVPRLRSSRRLHGCTRGDTHLGGAAARHQGTRTHLSASSAAFVQATYDRQYRGPGTASGRQSRCRTMDCRSVRRTAALPRRRRAKSPRRRVWSPRRAAYGSLNLGSSSISCGTPRSRLKLTCPPASLRGVLS
jgi:hypothetical protein